MQLHRKIMFVLLGHFCRCENRNDESEFDLAITQKRRNLGSWILDTWRQKKHHCANMGVLGHAIVIQKPLRSFLYRKFIDSIVIFKNSWTRKAEIV